MTATYSIGKNTFRESIRQPVYWAIIGLTAALMVLSVLFAGFNLGQDSTLVRDAGLTSITIAGLLLAIFLSSNVVADEIDKKTALTVLCKPVARFEFLLGKYLGLLFAIFFGYLLLSVVLLITVWHFETPIYYLELIKAYWSGDPLNIRQLYMYSGHAANLTYAGKPLPFAVLWDCMRADFSYFGGSIFPHMLLGVLLSFAEVAILASAAIAVSTRAGMIVNVCLMFSLFIIGHQAGYLANILTPSGETPSALLTFGLRLIPNFEFLNYASDIAFDKIVPAALIGQLSLYTFGWVGVFLLLANMLFDNRELS